VETKLVTRSGEYKSFSPEVSNLTTGSSFEQVRKVVEDFIKTMSPSKNGLKWNISSSFVRGAYLVRKQKMDTLMVVDRKTDELNTVFGNEGWATAINKVGYEVNRNGNNKGCGFDACVDMDLVVVVQV
jgi:hypothetical protein